MIIDNSHLRVFISNRKTDQMKYCGSTGIFRVIFDGGKARVILKEIITEHYGPRKDYYDGAEIIVTHSEYGDPSIFEIENIYLQFANCKIVRSWIPSLVPTRSKDAGALTYWIEIETEEFMWKGLPE